MSSLAITPNSNSQIHVRLAAGRWTWTDPLVMLTARTFLVILAQGFVTLLYIRQGAPSPHLKGAAWWQVTGTFVDLGCLALLFYFVKQEGIRLRDLIGLDKSHLRRDIGLGLGLLVLVFPLVLLSGSLVSSRMVFGVFQPTLPAVLLNKQLPLWAALYSRLVWWVLWSPVEELTYNGYCLPRFQALTGGRTWLAVAIVGCMWALQHAFLPLQPDWKVFLFLFLQMLPLVIVIQLLYLRFRRLPPLIVMHWGMDLFSTLFMTSIL